MHDLACLYRFAQLYAHNAHNLCMGDEFFADHEFLGELYGTYEAAYDSLVERMIGLGQAPDLAKLQIEAVRYFTEYGSVYGVALQNLLYLETEFCKEIENTIQEYTCGTQNLLQGLADESEMRQYKLGQRLKPDTDAKAE